MSSKLNLSRLAAFWEGEPEQAVTAVEAWSAPIKLTGPTFRFSTSAKVVVNAVKKLLKLEWDVSVEEARQRFQR